jgi:ribonuclease III
MDVPEAYSQENFDNLNQKLDVTISQEFFEIAITTPAGAKEDYDDKVKSNINYVKLTSNQRLEFLGDSVLKFILSEYIYEKCDDPEEKMTLVRIEFEKNKTLRKIALDLEINNYLLLGEGETSSKKIGGDALEAIFGAIYSTHKDFDEVRNFVLKYLQKHIDEILTKPIEELKDPKTRLKEYCDKHGYDHKYKPLGKKGPDNDLTHFMEVFVDGKFGGKGEGKKIKEAEQNAAKEALKILGI